MGAKAEPEKKQIGARELALRMLLAVTEEGQMCHAAVSGMLAKYPEMEKKERAFASMLCIGCIKRRITLDYQIGLYSAVPVKKLKPAVRAVLRLSFYQLSCLDTPPSAVCNEAVKLIKQRGLAGLSGFVNGVLRNAVRNPADLMQLTEGMETEQKLSIRYSMPEWLTERFLSWYGREQAEEIFRGFLEKSDITVRVNLAKIGQEECRRLLCAEGIAVRPGAYVPSAFHLSGIDSVEKLAAFRQGFLQVQDESSMLAVLCAGIRPGDVIIDCCAAPGGKTVHAADLLCQAEAGGCAAAPGRVSARDISEWKQERIRENIMRTGFQNVEILTADAKCLRREDIASADVVLADLPCSGLGVIGRKPDIKYNAAPEALAQLVQLQREILRVVSQYLKPGGVLIYSTCTMNREENEGNAEWIAQELGLSAESLDAYLPEALHSADTKNGRLQLMPEPGKNDGFFISRFRKPSGC